MNEDVNTWLQLLARWAHVVAGVIWIGHLYFFNWVNAHFAKTMEGPVKQTVVPQLMPRALYWFRWGAAWTWITGFMLAGLVYYMGGQVFETPDGGEPMVWLGIFLVLVAVGFVIYNLVMKSVKNVLAANAIVLALFVASYFFLEFVGNFGGRSLYIHAGMILGTIMALNVWMVIWPAQKRIIRATKEGTAADAVDVAQAGLRSRHNTFMSAPLIFFMLSNHYPTIYGATVNTAGLPMRDWYFILLTAIGLISVRLLYGKAAKVQGF